VFNDLEQTEPLELAILSNCALCPKCRTPYRFVHFYDGRSNPNKTVYDEEEEEEERELARAIIGGKIYLIIHSAFQFFLNIK
jgi:hypothetical protein